MKQEQQTSSNDFDINDISKYDFGISLDGNDDYIFGLDARVFKFLAYEFCARNAYGSNKEINNLLTNFAKSDWIEKTKTKIICDYEIKNDRVNIDVHPDSCDKVQAFYHLFFNDIDLRYCKNGRRIQGDTINSVITTFNKLINNDINTYKKKSDPNKPDVSLNSSITLFKEIRDLVNVNVQISKREFTTLCLLTIFVLAIYEQIINKKSWCKEYIDIKKKCVTGKRLQKALNEYFLQEIDKKRHITLIDAIDLYHTGGNFIPCPPSFNQQRSNIADDYWEGTLLHIKEYYSDRQYKGWLNQFDRWLSNFVNFETFIEENYLQDYVEYSGDYISQIKSLFRDGKYKYASNKLKEKTPQVRKEYILFFNSMYDMIISRNQRMLEHIVTKSF